MGYPLRWEETCAPQSDTETQAVICEREVPCKESLKRYFRRLVLLTFSGSALLVLSVVGVSRLFLSDRQAPALRLDSAPAGIAVSAVVPKVVRHVGFVVITGNLINRTATPLDKVEAVVDLLDASRHTLSTQVALIERDSVAPGQASDFHLEMADMPEAKAYRLRFKKLSGSEID